MKRRKFLALAGAATAWPLAARAQQTQKPQRIAFVHSGIPVDQLTEANGIFWIKRFYQELRALGHSEGANFSVERYSAGGRADNYAAVATTVVGSKPDVIVVNQNGLVKAFQAATSTIPIVGLTSDPIAEGLIASLARPGGNLTGVSVVAGLSIASKRLQILKEAAPGVTRVAHLLPSHEYEERSGVALTGFIVADATESQLRRSFAEMAVQSIDAVLVGEGGAYVAQRALIVELAANYRLPAIYPFRDFVDVGGLMSYAPDLGELAKRMAIDTHEILGGTKPGDIPYYQPSVFEFAVNLKTAKALGLAIPTTLLTIADSVIE